MVLLIVFVTKTLNNTDVSNFCSGENESYKKNPSMSVNGPCDLK